MPQSLVKIIVHVVWSTKDRVRMIPPEIELQLFAYFGGIISNNKGRLINAGCDADHIHILVSVGRIDVGELIGDIKRESSKWMKKKGVGNFYWQRGYGAFSIGESQVPAVSDYILNQKAHHRKLTFQDEFRGLCKKNNVDIDERYCWD
jgi:putative transposase